MKQTKPHLQRKYARGRALLLLLAWTIPGCSDVADEYLYGPGVSGPIALVGTRIIELDSGVVSASTDILIEDGLITDIRPTGSSAIPAEFHQFDANGAYVIPGLWASGFGLPYIVV